MSDNAKTVEKDSKSCEEQNTEIYDISVVSQCLILPIDAFEQDGKIKQTWQNWIDIQYENTKK